MSCVFSGAPRAGKTTVVKRLKGHHVDINVPLASTGVIDEKGVCRIDFVPSSSIVTDQEWIEMEEDDEVQAFLNLTIIPQRKSDEELVLIESKSDESKEESKNRLEGENERDISMKKLETKDEGDIMQESKKTDVTKEEPDTENERSTMQESKKTDVSKEEPDTENEGSKVQDSKKIDVSKEEQDTESERSKMQDSKKIGISKEEPQESEKNYELETEKDIEHESKKSVKDLELPTPMSVLMGALLHSRQIRACKRLSKRHFLLLTDTGGQPEFRKLIPVLIPGPSNTYIVFRLCDEFDSTLPVRFCCHNGKEIEYGRTFILREMINDILQNMHCSKVKGLLMFIGTHKDKIPESKRNSLFDQKNHELLEILKQCPYYDEDMVIKSDDRRIIFCVDNTTFENEHKCIRSRVLNLCQTATFQVKIKPEYLLFALTLKGTKTVILSFDECVRVAEKCGIKEKKDVQEALATLHEKLLMIRVYVINDDIIVVNKPKVLINKVSRTLKHMIERNSQGLQESRSNLISYSELQNIAASGEAMETEVFKNILLHLSIIAPLTKGNEGSTEYIVPCMGPEIKLEPLSDRWIKPNQVFFTFKLSVPSKPFQFSVPSTLTSLILCSLLQNKKYTAKLCASKVGITLRKDNVTFVIEIFQDCVSLHFENKSKEMLSIYKIMEDTLKRCIELVGYEVPNAMKCVLCPSCTRVQFAEVHGDMAVCLYCNRKIAIPEDNTLRGEFNTKICGNRSAVP